MNFFKNYTRKEKLILAMPEFNFHITLSVDIDLENRTITMKGLDTVESLSAEASANLSANRTHLISITVKWYQSDCWADSRVFVCKSW